MNVRFESIVEPGFLSGEGVAPFWVCDSCGQKIQGSGNAVFQTDADGERTGYFWTLHKTCDTRETTRHPWQDLDQFMWELFTNAHFDWEGVKERRARNREFGVNN